VATLEDGARIGVIGGGPAGSLFAYFLLDLDVSVDVYEPRDFTKSGPAGCNMCGGIVSESLVQALAIDGIALPPTVVQRGIDSYVLHTDTASVKIDTPLHEQRIAALHRGGGPRDITDRRWRGLDAHLLSLAQGLGARVHQIRVGDVGWDDTRPQVRLPGRAETYDLLAFATGVNSNGLQLLDALGLQSTRCRTTKAYVTEVKLGQETISHTFVNSMHMFLLPLKPGGRSSLTMSETSSRSTSSPCQPPACASSSFWSCSRIVAVASSTST
jgi:flavin-dependent dehydrogenase